MFQKVVNGWISPPTFIPLTHCTTNPKISVLILNILFLS